jgi:DnaJ-domain-containing protein 1
VITNGITIREFSSLQTGTLKETQLKLQDALEEFEVDETRLETQFNRMQKSTNVPDARFTHN